MTSPSQTTWDSLDETCDFSELQEKVSWGKVGGLGVSPRSEPLHVTQKGPDPPWALAQKASNTRLFKDGLQ